MKRYVVQRRRVLAAVTEVSWWSGLQGDSGSGHTFSAAREEAKTLTFREANLVTRRLRATAKMLGLYHLLYIREEA